MPKIAVSHSLKNELKLCETGIQALLIIFSSTVTNGFTESGNKKIKVLKRNAFAYEIFKRFRNRILHMFAHQQLKNGQPAA